MPQMAPMSWLILFIMFSITFTMFNTMNYYSTVYTPHKTMDSVMPLTKSMIWKW